MRPLLLGTARRASQSSYDFEVQFGSVVTAARAGVVHAVRVDQPAGSPSSSPAFYCEAVASAGPTRVGSTSDP